MPPCPCDVHKTSGAVPTVPRSAKLGARVPHSSNPLPTSRMPHVVSFQPSQDGWGPRRPDAGSPVQSQERRDNACGVIASQGAGCLACSSRWRARSGLGGSGGATKRRTLQSGRGGFWSWPVYAQALRLSSCSFAPIACWFRRRRKWEPASTILCCTFALAERIPARALGAAVVGMFSQMAAVAPIGRRAYGHSGP